MKNINTTKAAIGHVRAFIIELTLDMYFPTPGKQVHAQITTETLEESVKYVQR